MSPERKKESTQAVPPVLSDEEIIKNYFQQVGPGQAVERNYIGRDECKIHLLTNNPVMLVCVSDLHIGSMATDYDQVQEIFRFVSQTKNAKMILLGDEIEGMSGKYMNTNTARVFGDTQKQKDILAKLLKPMVESDKLTAMVANYWGHNGWEEDATTTNPWLEMANRIGLSADRVVRNGGRVTFCFPSGYEHSVTMWHNPPGKSRFDTVYGLRSAAFGSSETSRSEGYMSGHIHKMGVGKEVYSGAKTSVYFISSGTAKGSSESVPPDRFGVKLGAPPTDPLGQGVIMEPKVGRKKEQSYPFASLPHGQMMNEAKRLLDWVESKGMTEELLQKISNEVEKKPKVTLIAGKSRVSGGDHSEERPAEEIKAGGEWIKNPYSKQEMRAPYDLVAYDIETKLPVTLHLLSNTRIGSSSEGYEELKTYHAEQVANDPHSMVVYLRNMIDKEAGKTAYRMEVLEKFRNLMRGTEDQTLAIMMCESLRSSSWRSPVVTGYEERFTGRYTADGDPVMKQVPIMSMPLAPGSYLATETDTPLIHHLSLVKMSIGPRGVAVKDKPSYVGAFADKLMKHGSYSRPEFGLKRMYDLYTQEKPGYVAGGHMPHAGSFVFYDGSNTETNYPMVIAPGWFAKYVDTMGKGNVMPGASAGQAIIFMPGSSKKDYMAFPTVDADETGYLQDAFTLLRGLEILGITNKVLGRRG